MTHIDSSLFFFRGWCNKVLEHVNKLFLFLWCGLLEAVDCWSGSLRRRATKCADQCIRTRTRQLLNDDLGKLGELFVESLNGLFIPLLLPCAIDS